MNNHKPLQKPMPVRSYPYEHLSPPQRRQLQAAYNYLASFPEDPQLSKGQSLSKYLKTLDPAVAEAATHAIRAYDFGRTGQAKLVPFGEVFDTKRVVEHLGVDERAMDRIFTQAAKEEVTGALIDRMGSDVDRPIDPPTREDAVRAAFDTVMEKSPAGQ